MHCVWSGDGPESWFYGESQDGKEGSFPGTFVRKIKQGGGSKISIGGLEHISDAPSTPAQVPIGHPIIVLLLLFQSDEILVFLSIKPHFFS